MTVSDLDRAGHVVLRPLCGAAWVTVAAVTATRCRLMSSRACPHGCRRRRWACCCRCWRRPATPHRAYRPAALRHHRTRTVNLLLACWMPGSCCAGVVASGCWRGGWALDLAAASTTHLARWLAVGVLVNGLAHLAVQCCRGAGRTPMIAKNPSCSNCWPYMAGLWWAPSHYGAVLRRDSGLTRQRWTPATAFCPGSFGFFRCGVSFFTRIVFGGLVHCAHSG